MAIETYRKLILLGSDQAERGYEQIVETYRNQKLWDQALTASQEGATKLPGSREMKMTLAQQLADNGQGAAAVAQVKSMLQSKPSDREVYLNLAQIETSLKHFKEAEEAAEQAEKLSVKPEEKDYAMFVAGSVYEREKKYDLAEQKFKTVLSDDPRNAPVLNYLGYMLADRGLRLEEAVGYIKTGRLKQAAAHWERALDEWSKTTKTQVDSSDVARVQKQLESARVKLAKEEAQK